MKDQKLEKVKLQFKRHEILTLNDLLVIRGGGNQFLDDPKTLPTLADGPV